MYLYFFVSYYVHVVNRVKLSEVKIEIYFCIIIDIIIIIVGIIIIIIVIN